MKKVKYLLWFFVLWFWLLFSSQSFADNVTIDWVVSSYNCANGCATYRYIFNNRKYINGWNSSYNAWFLWYQMNYDWVVHEDVFWSAWQWITCTSVSSVYNRLFNSSIYEFLPYSWSCASFSSPYYTWSSPNNYNYYTNSWSLINVALWRNTEFWRAFVWLSTNNWNTPKYWFWNSFAWINDYLVVNSANAWYFRFFYDLVNWHNPLSWFSPITLSWQYMTWLNAWEYLYYNWTRTNYWYIVDDWSVWTKFRHFWLFDMWYSYSYWQWLSQSSTTINRNQLRFTTVEDNIETALKLFGDVSYSDFNNYSYHWLLLIKWNTATDLNAWNWVYILSKDPTNVSRILYEHWSCNISNIGLIYSGGDINSPCVLLDAWYLTYSWSTSVLPFNWINDTYSITWRNISYPLIFDLAYQNTSTVWRTLFSGWKLCFSSDIYCYWFQTNSSVSIKDYYLNGWTNTNISQSINENVLSRCENDFQYQMANPILCNAVHQYLTTSYAMWSWYYYQYEVDWSWNVTINIIDQSWLFDWTYQGTWTVWIQDQYWNWVTNCEGWRCNPNPSNFSWSQYLISWSGGYYLWTWYYDFTKTWLFFKCPYPYSSLVTSNNWDLRIWNFDILWPINCFISAFNHWRTFSFVSDWWFDHPIITWETYNHNIMFSFLDFILSLWLFTLFLKIYHLLK